MSGIPVYTQSPISASKASGTTPQTTAAAQSSPLNPNPAPATATASVTSSYPPAQPGSAAVPAPTAAAQRYVPLQPTPTTKADTGQPAPQPGAVPTPLNRSVVPLPPKTGESHHSRQTRGPIPPAAQPFPPQMSYPPPTSAYGAQPPASSTSRTTAPSNLYPVAIPSAEAGGPRRSLEHPPGYHQNVYASDLTSDQRRAQEVQQQTNYSSGTQDNGSTGGFESESVWNTAKKWAQQAGEKISEAEAEVWHKINKD